MKTRNEASQIEDAMQAAGYTQTLILHATYTDGRRGYEAVGVNPTTKQTVRIKSADAWKVQQKRDANPELATKPVYMAFCQQCNRMVGVCVDQPEHAQDVAKFIQEHVAAGYRVEHKTNGDVWAAAWCHCGEEPSLFDQEAKDVAERT